MHLRRCLLAFLTGPVLTSLTACSGSVNVSSGGYDGPAVAAEIEQAQREAAPDLEVGGASCPEDVKEEKGSSRECTVEVGGVTAPYTVTFETVTDDGADFNFSPAKAIVDVSKAEGFLVARAEDQGLVDVTADCGQDTQDVELEIRDLDGTIRMVG